MTYLSCSTNEKCPDIHCCDKKVNITTAIQQSNGIVRYTCGRVPCKYSSQVNHPSHYNKAGRKECIVEMEEKYGAETTAIFCLTNAYKYLYRAGNKFGNSANQDVAKAKWHFDYANKLISKYGMLAFNGIRIEDTDLYLDIKEMLGNE